jgi:hypothetical protein
MTFFLTKLARDDSGKEEEKMRKESFRASIRLSPPLNAMYISMRMLGQQITFWYGTRPLYDFTIFHSLPL